MRKQDSAKNFITPFQQNKTLAKFSRRFFQPSLGSYVFRIESWIGLQESRYPRIGFQESRYPRIGLQESRYPRIGLQEFRYPRIGLQESRYPRLGLISGSSSVPVSPNRPHFGLLSCQLGALAVN